LSVIGGDTKPTQNVNVVVELAAQGDENSVGFSLNYDSTILSNPNVVLNADASTAFLTVNNSQTGKVGILLALPAGQAFTVGTKSLVTITFNTAPTNAYSSPVTFGDMPLAREVTNISANELTTNYLDGAVTFAQGYEADVAPRPTGTNNGMVTIADFTQIGRFVAGLDSPNQLNEFQRVDCAPKISLGNGAISVSDYTQAGRYAAGLDAVNPTGGSTAENLAFEFIDAKDLENLTVAPTVVRVVNVVTLPGQQVLVSVVTDTQGTENGFGFTLNYDQTRLSNPLVQLGSGVPANSALIPNTTQTGKVGVVLGLPFGQGLSAGTHQLVTIRFDVSVNAPAGQTLLTFGDTPVLREVSDVGANVLPSTFQTGAVIIAAPTAATLSITGRVTLANDMPLRLVEVILQSGNQTFTARTDAKGRYKFTNLEPLEFCIITVKKKGFEFAPPNLVFGSLINNETADFIGERVEKGDE